MPAHSVTHTRTTSVRAPSKTAAARENAPASITLWDRDALPIARDLLFVLAVFCYLIGFAYQIGKMSTFGIPVDLGDQQLTSLFSWALDAIDAGRAAYAGIVCVTVLVFFAAAFVKNRYVTAPLCRTFVHLLIAAAIVFAVFASVFEAWQVGVKKGHDYLSGREQSVGLVFDLAKHSPFAGDREAVLQVYVLSETPDSYEILRTNPQQQAVSVHRADVMLTYEDDRTNVTNLPFGNYASRLPTPPPEKTAETN